MSIQINARPTVIPENKRLVWIQLIAKYVTVGVLNTLIDAATYFILTRWLGLGGCLVLAKGIAYAVGMVNSFFWNRTWTFGSKSNPWIAAGLFTLTHFVALGINARVMAVSMGLLGISEGVSLVLATGAAFFWNFMLNKLVVFKN